MAKGLATAVCFALIAAGALASNNNACAAVEEEQALLATKTVVKKHEYEIENQNVSATEDDGGMCATVNDAGGCGCQWMINGGDSGLCVDKCACACRSANPGCTIHGSVCAGCYGCNAVDVSPQNGCSWMNGCGDDCQNPDGNAQACRAKNPSCSHCCSR